jgi:cytoskeletal protein RodZ
MKNKITKKILRRKKSHNSVESLISNNSKLVKDNIEITKNKITLGSIYRQKRIENKIDIAKASTFLKVRQFDLNAIENEEINKISKNIYAPGLIRSYGKFLKIDETLIEEKIREFSFRSNTDNKKHILVNIGEHLALTPKKELMVNSTVIAIFLILSMFMISYIYNKKITFFGTDEILNEITIIE